MKCAKKLCLVFRRKKIAEEYNVIDRFVRDLLRRKYHPKITEKYHFELVYPDRDYVRLYNP